MTYFVETEQFNQMISYSPYAIKKHEKNKVKYSLLDRIKDCLGNKWDRLKEGTRQTFDMVCFLSAELGFFYASDAYLSERHDISDRTVRNRFKELEELGQVIKVYRRAKRCNGRGKPIYLFVNHPYFKYWVELLKIEADFRTDFQTENAETPCESMEKPAQKFPTYSLPDQDHNNDLNVKDRPYIKFVPRSLQHFQAFFGKQVKDIYGRIWLAAKKLGITTDQKTMQNVGLITFEQLKKYTKEGKPLTEEQLCKLAYKISYNQLNDRLINGEILDINEFFRLIDHAKKPKLVNSVAEKVTREELNNLGVF